MTYFFSRAIILIEFFSIIVFIEYEQGIKNLAQNVLYLKHKTKTKIKAKSNKFRHCYKRFALIRRFYMEKNKNKQRPYEKRYK